MASPPFVQVLLVCAAARLATLLTLNNFNLPAICVCKEVFTSE